MSEDNFLQPEDDTTVSLINPEEQFPGLAGYVQAKYKEAETGRYAYEQRWLQSYKTSVVSTTLLHNIESRKSQRCSSG